MTSRGAWLAGVLLVGCAGDRPSAIVFSAASTGDVVSVIAETEQEAGRPSAISVAASSVLARQIAQGAPADVFVTADPAWIDWLVDRGVPVSARRLVARGRLVVVGPEDAGEMEFAAALQSAGRLAMADPSHVPAGQYARQALREADLWEPIQPRAVFLGDVRAALAAVEVGAADRAIVYASDAAASPRVRVLADVPHPPITFEVALLDDANGRGLFEALTHPNSVQTWVSAGFDPASP